MTLSAKARRTTISLDILFGRTLNVKGAPSKGASELSLRIYAATSRSRIH